MLQTAAEQGIIGVMAFTAFIGIALAYSFKTWRSDWLVRGFVCGSALFLLHQIVDDLMFFPKVASMWWIVLGIMISRSPYARANMPARCDEESVSRREPALSQHRGQDSTSLIS
jgi:hypothetical protein